MTSKISKIFMILAFALSAVAFVLTLLIYIGPQNFWLVLVGANGAIWDLHVTDILTIIKGVLLFVFYLVAFIAMLTSKDKKPQFKISLVMLILIVVNRLISPVFSSISSTLIARNYSANNLAVFTSLNSAYTWCVEPFALLALICFCIAFGTMCAKHD